MTMIKSMMSMRSSRMKKMMISNIEQSMVEPLCRMLLYPKRFSDLTHLTLTTTEYSAFTYRSIQVSCHMHSVLHCS